MIDLLRKLMRRPPFDEVYWSAEIADCGVAQYAWNVSQDVYGGLSKDELWKLAIDGSVWAIYDEDMPENYFAKAVKTMSAKIVKTQICNQYEYFYAKDEWCLLTKKIFGLPFHRPLSETFFGCYTLDSRLKLDAFSQLMASIRFPQPDEPMHSQNPAYQEGLAEAYGRFLEVADVLIMPADDVYWMFCYGEHDSVMAYFSRLASRVVEASS